MQRRLTAIFGVGVGGAGGSFLACFCWGGGGESVCVWGGGGRWGGGGGGKMSRHSVR